MTAVVAWQPQWQPIETCPWGSRDVVLRWAWSVRAWPASFGAPVGDLPDAWAELLGVVEPAPGPTRDIGEVLQVALDHAHDTGEYPVALRERIAKLLLGLRIATCWCYVDETTTERHAVPHRMTLARVTMGGGVAHAQTFFEGNIELGSFPTFAKASAVCDEALVAAGWVLT